MPNPYPQTKNPSSHNWYPDKIARVVHDIQDSPKISLPSLLTVLLARLLLGDNCEPWPPEIVKQSRDVVELMRKDAEAFCTDEDNIRSTDIRKLLRTYCAQNIGHCRHATLCDALNAILSEYREKEYGDLPAQSQQGGKDELIFIPNTLTALKSNHIAQHMPGSRRQPDILATYTSTLHENFKDHKDAEFKDWVQIITNDKGAGPSSSAGRLRWPDVHQTWEVTTTSGLFDAATFEQNNPEIEKALLASKSQDRSASSQHPKSRKRRSEEELPRKSKKARIESEPKPKSFLQQVTDEQYNLLPEIRCAYYAMERLSSSWNILHSTAVLLEDTKLSLRWYDAQGCFQSEAIDIVDQMPIFIVMLIIFQRFNKRMWGVDAEKVESGNEIFQPDREKRCWFELVGRRTFAAPADRVLDSSVEDTKDEMPLFYKSSWVNCIHLKEPDTINLAHQRANKLLPEKFRKMVTDHIPTVIASRICHKSATSTIRMLVSAVDDSAQFIEKGIRKHARVRVWLVTRKLEPVRNLEPPVFWKVFWEILRCHYLMWKIGIAHRDISIANLMCTKCNGSISGVLNDYDMATVMSPGSRCPRGYERSGTTPFIAVDLLVRRGVTMKRWYRHDLESFTWCLAWEIQELKPRRWLEKKRDIVFASKKSFITLPDQLFHYLKEKWLPVAPFAMKWFGSWRKYLIDIEFASAKGDVPAFKRLSESEKVALRDAEDEKKEDGEFVRLVIEAAKKVRYSKDIDVIQDASWIDVELLMV